MIQKQCQQGQLLNITLGVFGIVRHPEAVQFQLTDELLAVNKVLAATEGDEIYRVTIIQNYSER